MVKARHNFITFLMAIGCASTVLVAQNRSEPSELDSARAAFSKARGEYSEAAAAVSRAEVARMRLEKSIRVEFRKQPDLVEARQYAAETTRHYDGLRAAIRKELEADPAHQALSESARQAQEAVRTANAGESASVIHKVALVHALMSARAELTRFEAAAYALDPAVEDARVMMNEAHEEASKLERVYDAQARNDDRLKAAEDEIAHAKSRVAAARTAVINAAEKLAAAEKRESIRTAGRRADPPPIRRSEP
jgi:hypothetical protein